jgi:hypothetical protein
MSTYNPIPDADLSRRVAFESARLRYERATSALAASSGTVDEAMLDADEMVIVSSPLLDQKRGR